MTSPLVLIPSPPDALMLDACAGMRLLRLDEERHAGEALARHGHEVLAVANPGEGPLGRDLLAQMPNLELIAHFGVGYETIDVEEAVRRGIVVTNAAGSNDEEVADTAMGLLLMAVRELGRAERHLREGRWSQGSYPVTQLSLRDRSLGLLGIGNIGQAVARRAEAFGLTVAYHARNRRDLAYRYYDTLLELARDVDILVVAAPGGPSTRHLVDAEVLHALGPRGVLVNVARGSLVDEQALIQALRTGTLAAAGLDVYQDEPHVPPELVELENTVLLPHVGSASLPTRQAMARRSAANLTSWFADRTVLTPVLETRDLVLRNRW